MNFNATSLVQAVHFLITFWVIKRVFMRPALEVINDASEYKKKLGDETSGFDIASGHLIEQRDALWDDARGYFVHEQPDAPKQSDFVFHTISPEMNNVTPSPKQLSEFVQAAAHKVVERVEKSL
jgi:hypothetical protein